MPHIVRIIIAAIIVFMLLIFSRQFQHAFEDKLTEEDKASTRAEESKTGTSPE